jgi:hypothetical protein
MMRASTDLLVSTCAAQLQIAAIRAEIGGQAYGSHNLGDPTSGSNRLGWRTALLTS